MKNQFFSIDKIYLYDIIIIGNYTLFRDVEVEEMTLKQLRYITEVAETGNITEAANRLYIAQPSLTASIQELEKEFDAALEKALATANWKKNSASRSFTAPGKASRSPGKARNSWGMRVRY